MGDNFARDNQYSGPAVVEQVALSQSASEYTVPQSQMKLYTFMQMSGTAQLLLPFPFQSFHLLEPFGAPMLWLRCLYFCILPLVVSAMIQQTSSCISYTTCTTVLCYSWDAQISRLSEVRHMSWSTKARIAVRQREDNIYKLSWRTARITVKNKAAPWLWLKVYMSMQKQLGLAFLQEY